jgi:pantoate kinase
MASLRLLVTSHYDKDTEESLKDMRMIYESITTISTTDVVKDDYVRDKLQTDRSLKRYRAHPKLQKKIEESLTEKADGM